MRRLTVLIAIALVGGLITACSGSGTDTTAAPDDGGNGASAEITIADFTFSGAESVSVGDTVEVTNNDSVGHTWTASDETFNSGTLASGDSFEFTFDEAGEFDYFCQIHPTMTGSITVEG
jgi:plastocyanin